MSVASSRGAPGQRQPKSKPAFGTGPRKPLANKKRDQARMSADAEVQPDVAGRCILLGFMPGDCGEKLHRAHVVSQQLIRDTYPHGAWRFVGEEFWRPITREGIEFAVSSRTERDLDDAPTLDVEQIALQQILDNSSNLVNTCDAHNRDGLEMIEALDRRKVAGLPSYPAGFGGFTHAFRFSIEGATYWYYVPFEGAAA